MQLPCFFSKSFCGVTEIEAEINEARMKVLKVTDRKFLLGKLRLLFNVDQMNSVESGNVAIAF